MAKHLAARGGVARIEGVQSLPMTGTARAAGGREALVAREIKRPGRIRTEFTVQGLAGIHACDGERGWQVSLLDGEMEPRPMPPEEKVEIDPVLDDARFPDARRVPLLASRAIDGASVSMRVFSRLAPTVAVVCALGGANRILGGCP